jgi:hypothetical protein
VTDKTMEFVSIEREQILADSHWVQVMVDRGQLIPSSSRPGPGKYAYITRVDELDYSGRVKSTRLAVCAIGYRHNMREAYPLAVVKTKEASRCPHCGK